MSKLISKARAGVTLVELLVVILIVTILSVSLLPLLKPYIVKAQYAAEPIPVIGNLRTQIGLFQYDKNYLPGLPKNADGEVQCDATMMVEITEESLKGKGGISCLVSGKTPIQTFCPVDVTQTGSGADAIKLRTYRRAIIDTVDAAAVAGDPDSGEGASEATTLKVCLAEALKTGETVGTGITQLSEEDTSMYLANHFAKELGINYEDLTGKRMKPVHVQYRVLYGGYKSGTYAYAIGVFGDANGLAAGTGYAVLEIVNPDAGVKYVGTWERYKTISGNAGQIQMITTADDGSIDADNAPTKNCCWLGNPNLYLKSGVATSIANDVASAIADLTKAGWEFK